MIAFSTNTWAEDNAPLRATGCTNALTYYIKLAAKKNCCTLLSGWTP